MTNRRGKMLAKVAKNISPPLDEPVLAGKIREKLASLSACGASLGLFRYVSFLFGGPLRLALAGNTGFRTNGKCLANRKSHR